MLFTALVSWLKVVFIYKAMTIKNIAFYLYIVFCQGIQESTSLMLFKFDCLLNSDFLKHLNYETK